MPVEPTSNPQIHWNPGARRRERRSTPARIALACAAALLLGASEDARGELPASLLRIEETGLGLARKAIERDATLTPFAFVVRSDGRTQRVSPVKKRRHRGVSRFESLVSGLRPKAAAGEYEAVVIFHYVVITLPDGDEAMAIQVGIEDAQGHCSESFVPYRKTKDDEIELDPAYHRSREPQVFPRCDAPGKTSTPEP